MYNTLNQGSVIYLLVRTPVLVLRLLVGLQWSLQEEKLGMPAPPIPERAKKYDVMLS